MNAFPVDATIGTDCDAYEGETIGAAAQNQAPEQWNAPTRVHVVGPADQLAGFGFRAGDPAVSWYPVRQLTAFDKHSAINPFDPVGIVPQIDGTLYWVRADLVDFDPLPGDPVADVVDASVVVSQAATGDFIGAGTTIAAPSSNLWMELLAFGLLVALSKG